MKTILMILFYFLAVLAVLAIGSGLLVLLAYGVGLLLSSVTHFDPFQATVIGLAGMFVFVFLLERWWTWITSHPPFPGEYYEDEDDDDEYDDELPLYPSIPRWRQPLKQVDFSNAKPDDHCPCGSGRKYKNCHGPSQKR